MIMIICLIWNKNPKMCYPFDIEDCEEFTDKRTRISVEEKKKIYSARNKNQNEVCLIRIDDCLIEEGNKCDYLLLNCDSKVSYFIELKGKDMLHAVEQIDRSIDLLINKISEYAVNARIVLKKVYPPDLKSNKYKKLEKKLKKYKGTLLKHENILEEDI